MNLMNKKIILSRSDKMFKNLFKKKEKKKNTYHAFYEDELFFEGVKLIAEKELNEESLIALGSLMGVVLFRGDMKRFNEFLIYKSGRI
jgi:hypothetical protein